jgi:hypothetical protein
MRALQIILMVPFFIALASATCFAQTTLIAGDISIVGFNANSPDGFSFVNWVDLSPNTVIKFTDNGFNTSLISNTALNYREQEQYVVWTNNTGNIIPAGTIITIQANSATAPTATVTNIGTITSVTNSSNGGATSNMSLTNTSGDQIFAFQGTGGPSTGSTTATFSGTLLFGFNYSGSSGTATTWQALGAINGSTSYLPLELIASQIAIGPNVVGGQYTGPTTGQLSLAAYKLLVANTANWTTVGTTGTVILPTSTAVTFTAGTPPVITSQPSNSSICAGTNTTFSITASNASTYQWQVNTGSGFVNLSNGAPYSGVNTATLTITGATSALNGYQYQAVVTGASTPNATSNAVTLTVKANPAATATPTSASICSGTATNIALTSTPTGASFAWTAATASGTVTGTSAGSGTSIAQTLSGNGVTNYTVTPTLNSCPGTPVTVAVTVNPNPTATATPTSASICSGSATNIALTSTPTGATFAWTAATASGTVTGTSAGSGTSIAQTLSGNGVTNYTVTPTLNSCPGTPITVAITVKPAPTATATPASASVCSGTATNIALTSTPTGATFAWTAATASGTVTGSSASSGTSIAQTLSGNGVTNYTVTPTLNSCPGTPVTVAVTVNPNPTATATPTSASICSGSATNIALTSTPTGASFAWTAATASGTVTGSSAGSGTSIAQTLSGNGVTNYTVTPTLNSCPGTPITVAITVKPAPTATATPASASVCSGSATNIALTSTPTGATFAWTAATASGTVTGTSAGSGTSIAQTLSGNGVTNYTVTPTLNSCPGTPVTVSITVNANPVITNQPSASTICTGANTTFSVSAANTTGYQWQVDAGAGFVNITNDGTYSGATTAVLTITSATAALSSHVYRVNATGGCTPAAVSNSVLLTVNTAPVITDQPTDRSICGGADATFSVSATNATGYQWQVDAGLGFVNILNAAPYSGATTSKLTISSATQALNGYLYRAVVTGACSPPATSGSALLSTADNVNPIITGCPADIAVNVGSPNCSNIVTWTEPTVTDNCSSTILLTSDHHSGDMFVAGNTVVTYIAKDLSGNEATCSFTVTVTDVSMPVFTSCPEDAVITAGEYIFTAPVATDNCSIVTVEQTAGLASGTIFPEGVTVQTFEATDVSGNKATCSFTVTASVATSAQMGKLNNVRVYPNPASDVVYISPNTSSANEYVILLQDISGKVILQQNLTAAQNDLRLDVKDVSKGIYFLVIRDASNQKIEKIIIE